MFGLIGLLVGLVGCWCFAFVCGLRATLAEFVGCLEFV